MTCLAFDDANVGRDAERTAEKKVAKIDQLIVARDFLAKRSGQRQTVEDCSNRVDEAPSLHRQCAILGVARFVQKPANDNNLAFDAADRCLVSSLAVAGCARPSGEMVSNNAEHGNLIREHSGNAG